MIKFYAYYSCGGYKDMYLANSEMPVEYTYFLPLLPIWQSAMKLRPKDAERLVKSKTLTMIQLITSEQDWGFPKESELFFSHGAYRAIYRSLDTGGSCLGLAGLDNGEHDEFGRAIPFCMVITADRNDTDRLDALALRCIKEPKEMWKALGGLLGYSPEMNGLKFNLNAANSIIKTTFEENTDSLEHHPGKINYLLVPVLSDLNKALIEQQLNRSFIDFVCTLQGESEGGLRYKSTVPIVKRPNPETKEMRVEESHDIEATSPKDIQDVPAVEVISEKKEWRQSVNDDVLKDGESQTLETRLLEALKIDQKKLSDDFADIVAERVKQIVDPPLNQIDTTIASLSSKVEQLSSTIRIPDETSEHTDPDKHPIKGNIAWLYFALCLLGISNFVFLIILLFNK